MIVMKFGGTSVGAARPFATACEVVASARRRDPVVGVEGAR